MVRFSKDFLSILRHSAIALVLLCMPAISVAMLTYAQCTNAFEKYDQRQELQYQRDLANQYIEVHKLMTEPGLEPEFASIFYPRVFQLYQNNMRQCLNDFDPGWSAYKRNPELFLHSVIWDSQVEGVVGRLRGLLQPN